MVHFMKDIGWTILQMAEVGSLMLMEIIMKDIEKMIKVRILLKNKYEKLCYLHYNLICYKLKVMESM